MSIKDRSFMNDDDYGWLPDNRYAIYTNQQTIASALASLTTVPDDDDDEDEDEEVGVHASSRIDRDEMLSLDNEDKKTMMRQRVTGDDLTQKMLDWCEENCTDLWCYYNDVISFLNKEDQTLFLVTFRGS